jgi:dTMP kinase
LPALARGDWVISDRFTDATFAYQGGGRGCARSKLEALEEWVPDGLRPDLTLLLDVPTETAHARLGAARARDKFERQSLVFFERVRNEYLRRAHETPERFLIINAARTIPEIQVELEKIIARL